MVTLTFASWNQIREWIRRLEVLRRASRSLSSGIQPSSRSVSQKSIASKRVDEQLLRIGQEAISNAIRHGHADEIDVRIEYRRHSLSLRVADNGSGFVPAQRSRGSNPPRNQIANLTNGAGGKSSTNAQADVLPRNL